MSKLERFFSLVSLLLAVYLFTALLDGDVSLIERLGILTILAAKAIRHTVDLVEDRLL